MAAACVLCRTRHDTDDIGRDLGAIFGIVLKVGEQGRQARISLASGKITSIIYQDDMTLDAVIENHLQLGRHRRINLCLARETPAVMTVEPKNGRIFKRLEYLRQDYRTVTLQAPNIFLALEHVNRAAVDLDWPVVC